MSDIALASAGVLILSLGFSYMSPLRMIQRGAIYTRAFGALLPLMVAAAWRERCQWSECVRWAERNF